MRPIRLRTGLLATLLGTTLLLLAVAGAAGYVGAQRVLEEELRKSLASLAAVTASQVNGERMLLVAPGDDSGGGRVWRNLSTHLEEVRASADLRRVFAVDREGRVRADTGRRERAGEVPVGQLPVGAEVPELLQDQAELALVWQGRPAASQVLFEGLDKQLYLRGYAPVRTGEGEVVGAVGVEGSAAFFGPLHTLARRALAGAGLAAAGLTVAGLLAAAALARPLRRLLESALRIGRGDLSTPVSADSALYEVSALARELEAMRQALEGRDRQLKMMLAGVAHEVKNPLGGIELFGGLLAEELQEGQPEARAHLSRIQGEVAYLKRIVEDFLVFAREQRLNHAPFGAADWLRTATSHLEGEARGRGVQLEAHAQEASLEGDVGLLTAALVNLVKNALQASSAGGRVQVRGVCEAGRYVVEVEDAGGGIPEEAQARIWEPFFTTREKGTGLGLPLTRKLVEAHGGTLALSSRPGCTVFRLMLPLTVARTSDPVAA